MTMQHLQQPGSAAINAVYDRIKARVIDHQFPAGKRVPIDELAKEFIVSATPIREALIRLSCERLIDEVPKAGFFAKEISEREISDLYELQLLLLQSSLNSIGRNGSVLGMLKPPSLAAELTQAEPIAPKIAVEVMNKLSIHIARQSGKADLVFLVANINERTFFIRKNNFEIFDDSGGALVELCQSYEQRDLESSLAQLQSIFHSNLERLPEVIRCIRGSFLKAS